MSEVNETVRRQVLSAPCVDDSADIMLKSSDDHYLRAHRVFLVAALPIFTTMFSLPRPVSSIDGAEGSFRDAKDGLEVVQMFETKEELDMLLRLIYPAPRPSLESTTQLKTALRLAEKFDAEHVRNLAHLSLVRLTERASEAACVIAWDFQLRDIARLAAKSSLSRPNLDHSANSEVDEALLAYRRRCCATAAASVRDLKWVKRAAWVRLWDAKGPCPGGCPDTESPCLSSRQLLLNGLRPVKNWLVTYLSAAYAAVQQRPQGSAVKTVDVFLGAATQAGGCQWCKDRAPLALQRFAEVLAARIDRKVDTVAFETSF
ncbi:hypothetical protein PENSPDRAFT_431469 [Peniophora sp. CONT]|nr:hypothetical protein PENSPDRAFT_431469 [Peniophora sp. CONT]